MGSKAMRTITLLIIHCSAVAPHQTSSAAEIDRWHKAQGWQGIGYHYVIRRDGTIETGRPETDVGAHCKTHNQHSIGICYEGGLKAEHYTDATTGQTAIRYVAADTRTERQKDALRTLLVELRQKYPQAFIVGHHDLNKGKACPCFDAAREYKTLQPH